MEELSSNRMAVYKDSKCGNMKQSMPDGRLILYRYLRVMAAAVTTS